MLEAAGKVGEGGPSVYFPLPDGAETKRGVMGRLPTAHGGTSALLVTQTSHTFRLLFILALSPIRQCPGARWLQPP